jgi:hypothetical protein
MANSEIWNGWGYEIKNVPCYVKPRGTGHMGTGLWDLRPRDECAFFARIPPSVFIGLVSLFMFTGLTFLYNFVFKSRSLRIRVPFMKAPKAGASSFLLSWIAVALHQSKPVCYMRAGLSAIRDPGLKSSEGVLGLAPLAFSHCGRG